VVEIEGVNARVLWEWRERKRIHVCVCARVCAHTDVDVVGVRLPMSDGSSCAAWEQLGTDRQTPRDVAECKCRCSILSHSYETLQLPPTDIVVDKCFAAEEEARATDP
jgi:hypothetical protein